MVISQLRDLHMTYSVESKNQLAKLLATENLTIEHRKVPTASFDMKNRVLTCPIWKDMSGDLYDLFLGHEVGHALETPLDGWHDSVSNKGKNYKHFLNVVEDARIEKKIKRRYPGLKRSFVSAYNRLFDENFFGVKHRNLNKLSLVDKINLYFKCGISTGIKFNDTEMEFVNQIESCETWDDVVVITDKLFAYCKEEQQQINQDHEFGSSESYEIDEEMDSMDSDDSDDYEESDDEMDFEEGQEGNKSAESEDESEDESEKQSEDESEDTLKDGLEDKSKVMNHDKDSEESTKNQFEPECKTDEYFRKNESSLLDATCLPYVYVNIPQANLDHIVTPQKRVQEILTQEFTHYDRKKYLAEFKRKNDNYVGLLAKEFEMRKAATRYAKRKVSNTGDIDVNKIYKYQLDDSIFRKITKVPNGKSHGLIMLLDCSGSMSDNINGAIEQIMVLAMFCRRVNIPFAVYGFGNNNYSWTTDFPEFQNNIGVRKCFSRGVNEMSLHNVSLREYLNSEMGNGEFTNALANLATLKKQYEKRRRIPPSEHLSNTPLTQAMVAMKSIVENFRKVRKLDIVNLAIVHDGDADYCKEYKDSEGMPQHMDHRKANYVLVDNKNKVQIKLDHDSHNYNCVRVAICDWFTKVTGVKIFGFFIVPDSSYKIKQAIMHYYYIDGEKFIDVHTKNVKQHQYWNVKIEVTTQYAKEFRNKKLFVSKNPGYEKFFLILGGKSLITDDDLDMEEGASIRKLKTAFTKKYNHRKTNRVLVNQFIEGIAA